MTELRHYLLRVVACAFLLSVISVLVSNPRMQRLLRLCGACFMALAVLQPLFHVPWAELPDYLYEIGISKQAEQEEAKEKNNQILAGLIQSQTEQVIAQALQAQGIQANFQLTLQYEEAVGAPIPWRIVIHSDCSEEKKQAFSDYLQQELGIPKERQEWHYG